jgi:ribonuclease P protein component
MKDERKKFDSAVCRSSFIVPHSSFCFPRSHRLSGKLLFAAVYDAKMKSSRGPLVMYSLPNELGHLRMGISISRKVGIAPKRNRIKRLLREAFRLNHFSVASGYDLVIVVRPHEPMPLGEYQQALGYLIQKSESAWQIKPKTGV